MLVTKQPVFRRFWYPVLPVSRLDDGPKQFILLGEKIVVWRDGEGMVSALQDRCCHRTAELSRGYCENGVLVCGYHGWNYDRTGRCIKIPQLPSGRVPPNTRVTSYRADERYGYVWVCLGDEPLTGIPDIPEATRPGYRLIQQFYEEMRTSGLRLMENSFDPAHVQFTHRGTFGDPVDAADPQMDIMENEWGLTMTVQVPVKNTGLAKDVLGTAGSGAKTTRSVESIWWMPFFRRTKMVYPNGLEHTLCTAATPIDDRTSMICQFALRNDTEAQVRAEDVIAFDRKIVEEDVFILEGTDPDVPLEARDVERSIAADKPGLMMRRMLLRLLARNGEKEVTNRLAAAPPGVRPVVSSPLVNVAAATAEAAP